MKLKLTTATLGLFMLGMLIGTVLLALRPDTVTKPLEDSEIKEVTSAVQGYTSPETPQNPSNPAPTSTTVPMPPPRPATIAPKQPENIISESDRAGMAKAEKAIKDQELAVKQNRCNEARSQRDAAIVAENANHVAIINEIQLEARRAGVGHWGGDWTKVAEEDARHGAATDAINSRLASQISQLGCST